MREPLAASVQIGGQDVNEMLDTLANWAQILSVPLAILAIAVSIWLFRRNKQTRALACIFDPFVSPIEIRAGNALKGHIEIRYKGQPVDNILVTRVKVKNVGNQPIRKTDVIEPVKFIFESGTELIREPRTVDRRPANLKVEWSLGSIDSAATASYAVMEFDLLNPGEELSAEFICTGASKWPRVVARIEGVSEIQRTLDSRYRLSTYNLILSILYIPLGIGLVVVNVQRYTEIPSLFFMCVGTATVYGAIVNVGGHFIALVRARIRD